MANATETVSTAKSDFAIDSERHTLGTAFSAYLDKLRGGDLGSLPGLLAIFVLTAVFVFGDASRRQGRGMKFLSIGNLGNFLQQAAPTIVIAMAVSFVLLLGEIDLAAGWSAGVVAAVLALRIKTDSPDDIRGLAIGFGIAIGVAVLLGLFTGFLVAKVGIPAFVVTLANFLSFQGILLLLAKEGGTIRVQNKAIVAMENSNLSRPLSWVFTLACVALFAFTQVRKQQASRGSIPIAATIIRIAVVAAIAIGFTALLSRNRAFATAKRQIVGIPYAVPIVLILLLGLTFLLSRTAYGRHLYAVGGNAEAARRAGINVTGIRISAFVLCAVMAGIGGIFIASRLNSVSPQTGGNDTLLLAVGAAVIGGTSLFGGKGRMANAVLGGVVLALIENGLPLVNKAKPFGIAEVDFSDSGVKFIVSGLVLLLAASVDALSRKR
jgi:D-xylose transport system permease protein